jgi:DNA-binding NtrC family response regulator
VEKAVDVRVIAASRDDLSARVAEGTFRSDLFFRLSVLRVALPPLRARREDLPVLVSELLRRRGLEPGEVSGPLLDVLTTHDWPGNVRELRNVVDRALALSPHAHSFGELRLSLASSPSAEETLTVRTDLTFADAKEQVNRAFELRYLRDVLGRCHGNLSAAAREANLDRKHLRALARKHGLIGEGEDSE